MKHPKLRTAALAFACAAMLAGPPAKAASHAPAASTAAASSATPAPAGKSKAGGPGSGTGAADKGPTAPVEKIDLNSAREQDLATLPGIDAAKARRIVKHRPYDDLESLVRLNVLTAKEVLAIKDRARVVPPASKK